MRGEFIRTLIELTDSDPRIVLLSGDLGFMALECFRDKFPNRFFNVGVAEQNMIGLATGLAEAGFMPFVYSIVTFATLRSYEFIRNGPILHKLPVRIIGIGGGFEYGHNGATHYGLEDIGIMRIQPGITIIAPADCKQTRKALLATWNFPGPIYYRLGKDDKTIVPDLEGRFELGRAQFIGDGKDIAIITMGSITSEVSLLKDALITRGIHATIIVIASINPTPIEDLVKALAHFSLALTVEAHYISGGIGSMACEVIAEKGLRCRIIRCAVKTTPDGKTGDQTFLYHKHGLSSAQLVDVVCRALDNRG